MKTKSLTLFIAYLFLVVSLPVLLGLDMDDGVEAMQRGDDKEAAKFFHLAAEQGNKNGQFALGVLYSDEGPLKDNKKAAKFTRLAAEQGHPIAQVMLGSMYLFGRGVPQNYVLSHMWWNLSGHEGREKNKTLLEKKMTPLQIEEAKELARNWKPDKSKSIWQKLKGKITTLNE